MSAPLAEDTHENGLPLACPDDKALALAFQQGERDAYRAIHERHQERVHRVCRRMLGKREDAQEAAQETFLRVYQALGKFNGRYHLGAWITRIATNVCLDQIRARSRRPYEATPLDELETEMVASPTDSDPESVSVRKAESRRVRKVLLGLPPMHRAAIVLRDFEGLSYAEVAVALGVTECQVKALIHRARKGFRRSWTPLAEALVPARLLQRLRDTDVSVRDQAVHVAASQSAPVASVCSGLLQHCGSFVVQKVVPFATSVVVGGSAAFAAPGGPPPPSSAPVAVERPTAEAATPEVSVRERSDTRASAPPTAPSAAPATEAPATAAPEPPPGTTPTPTPSPAPTATASPEPPSGTATPGEASPAPFTPTFYFEKGQTPTPRAPSSNTTKVNCATRSFEQTATGTVSDHEGAYPIDVRIWASSSISIEFTVRKQGIAVYYSGGGSLTGSSNTGDRLNLSFVGRYGSGGGAAASANLPPNGSLRADFTLDCGAHALIAESIVFTTQ